MGGGTSDDMGKQQTSLEAKLSGVIGKLEAEAKRRVGLKSSIEQRWLEDLRAYHGRYDPTFEAELNQSKDSSKANMNRTRRKTRAMAARLKEMLFPGDDSNWGMEPTPVPELTAQADKAARDVIEGRKKAAELADEEGKIPPEAEAKLDALEAAADALSAKMDEAADRCNMMRREIEDALVESRYETAARRAIDAACKLGAGVIKGPVQSTVRRAGWRQGETGEFGIAGAGEMKPEFRWVDHWSFFPDPDARTLEESDGVYERHLLNDKGLRRLAKDPDFDKDAIRKLIKDGTKRGNPDYISSLREITSEQISKSDVHHVWEFTGPLDHEDVQTILDATDDIDNKEALGEIDALTEIHAVIWFCGTALLKFGIYPLESDEPLYSMFVLDPEEASVWGNGVPRLMRPGQNAANAGWRAMLDNGGYALGPHIIVNDDMVEPEDGDWTLKGPKIWRMKKALAPGQRAFDQFQPTMNQEQLANIIGLAEKQMDEETGMSAITMGDQNAATTKTVGGMALLMSQGSLPFREIVRRFDDEFTVPNLRRTYDWMMQFSAKDHIKGDYAVKARGSSVLLVREMESQNLLMIASVYGADDPDLKADKIKRAMFRSLMLDPDEFIRTESEKEAWLDQQQKGPTEADVQMAEIQARDADREAKIQIANMETDSRLKVAQLSHDAQMMALAQAGNMKLEELESLMKRSDKQIQSKERIVAAEAAMSDRERQAARAEGRDPMGSGGFIA